MRRVLRGAGRSVDRGACRPAIEPRQFLHRGADAVEVCGRQHDGARQRERSGGPAWSETPACTDAPCAGTGRSPVRPPRRCAAVRIGKAGRPKPMMHGREKSDPAIVATKPTNAAGQPAAEPVERRAGTKGNAGRTGMHRTPCRESVSPGLARVRQAARDRPTEKFTALLHHIDVDLLRWGYLQLKREAAAGVDGVTWLDYGDGLEARLQDLHARVHRGSYRARPSRRRYIPKPDGRQRPLGIAALEDKIVQRATVELLNAIYEEVFLGFSPHGEPVEPRLPGGTQPARRAGCPGGGARTHGGELHPGCGHRRFLRHGGPRASDPLRG